MIPATSKVHTVVAAMISATTACDKFDGGTSFADISYFALTKCASELGLEQST